MRLIIIVLPGLETVRAAAKQSASLTILRREVQAVVGAVGLVVMIQLVCESLSAAYIISVIEQQCPVSDRVIQAIDGSCCAWLVARAIRSL